MAKKKKMTKKTTSKPKRPARAPTPEARPASTPPKSDATIAREAMEQAFIEQFSAHHATAICDIPEEAEMEVKQAPIEGFCVRGILEELGVSEDALNDISEYCVIFPTADGSNRRLLTSNGLQRLLLRAPISAETRDRLQGVFSSIAVYVAENASCHSPDTFFGVGAEPTNDYPVCIALFGPEPKTQRSLEVINAVRGQLSSIGGVFLGFGVTANETFWAMLVRPEAPAPPSVTEEGRSPPLWSDLFNLARREFNARGIPTPFHNGGPYRVACATIWTNSLIDELP
jgi:hypothetical protein